jgi:hypothetical protein
MFRWFQLVRDHVSSRDPQLNTPPGTIKALNPELQPVLFTPPSLKFSTDAAVFLCLLKLEAHHYARFILQEACTRTLAAQYSIPPPGIFQQKCLLLFVQLCDNFFHL